MDQANPPDDNTTLPNESDNNVMPRNTARKTVSKDKRKTKAPKIANPKNKDSVKATPQNKARDSAQSVIESSVEVRFSLNGILLSHTYTLLILFCLQESRVDTCKKNQAKRQVKYDLCPHNYKSIYNMYVLAHVYEVPIFVYMHV